MPQDRCRHCGKLVISSTPKFLSGRLLKHMEAEHGHTAAREALGERILEDVA